MAAKRQLDDETIDTTPIQPPNKKRKLNDSTANDSEDTKEEESPTPNETEDKNANENKEESSKSSKSSKPTKPTKTKEEIDEDKLAKWDNLKVGTLTKRAINKLGFAKMTEIQYKAIPPVLVCSYNIK